MYFKKETDYALRLLTAIGEGCTAEPLSLAAFAKDAGISHLFLQRIAAKLRQAGLINARKGAIGGYWLAKPKNQISVHEVMEAIEGPLSQDTTDTAIPFSRLQEDMTAFFKNKTLTELLS